VLVIETEGVAVRSTFNRVDDHLPEMLLSAEHGEVNDNQLTGSSWKPDGVVRCVSFLEL
jgi:hypothetical protein